MKKLIIILTMALFAGVLSAQNSFIYPFIIGKTGTATGQITLRGITSGSAVIRVNAVAGTGIIFELPVTNGTNGQVLTTNGNGVLSWNVGGVTDTTHLSDRIDLKVNIADTASMLNPYALTSEVRNEIADSLNARIGAGVELSDIAVMIADTLLSAPIGYYTQRQVDSVATTISGVSIGDVRDEIADSLNVLRPLYIAVVDTSSMLTNYSLTSEVRGITSDSLALAKKLDDVSLFFAPVIGLGNAGDTIAFSHNDVIWGCQWDGDYDLVITKVSGVVHGTSPDIDIALWYDTNFRDGTPTEVLSADLTITSTTSGDSTTSFASATIEPGEWIWITVEEQTAQPTQCIINIYGYLSE